MPQALVSSWALKRSRWRTYFSYLPWRWRRCTSTTTVFFILLDKTTPVRCRTGFLFSIT
jgi:hypothetical protein